MSVAADFAASLDDAALRELDAPGGTGTMFGRKEAVDPVSFVIGSAAGWGGDPPEAAVYEGVFPKANDRVPCKG